MNEIPGFFAPFVSFARLCSGSNPVHRRSPAGRTGSAALT